MSQNNLHLPPDTSESLTRYTSDVVAFHNPSKQFYWLLSVYSPCEGTLSHRAFHAILHEAILRTIPRLRLQHAEISLIIGGDFNYDPARTELHSAPHHARHQPWSGFQELAWKHALDDSFVSIAPNDADGSTNRSGNGARLDRFYTSPTVTSRLYSFSKLDRFSGSHNGILITFLHDPKHTLCLGRGRYVLKPNPSLEFFIRERFATQTPLTYAEAILTMQVADFETHPGWRKAVQRDPSMIPLPPARHFLSNFKPKTLPTYLHTLRATPTSDSTTSTDGMVEIGKRYFASIYDGVDPPRSTELEKWLSILNGVQLTPERREDLEQPFNLEELDAALLSMNNGASPGEDGISVTSLKTHWKTLGTLLVQEAESLQNGVLLPCFEEVIIMLIPKQGTSELIQDYRPISLSQSGLCVISRAMNTRLLKYADNLIGVSQRGFIPARRIEENTTEVLSLIRKFRDDQSYNLAAIALLDQSKAFDRVLHH